MSKSAKSKNTKQREAPYPDTKTSKHVVSQTRDQMMSDYLEDVNEGNDLLDEDEEQFSEQDEDDEEKQYYYDEENLYTMNNDEELISSTEEETALKFLSGNMNQNRSLADIIMEKLREKESQALNNDVQDDNQESKPLPPKVVEVYTAVGNLLQHYRSGKIPKALKMLPNLKNWENILWLTRPDSWSPCGTYAVTRIFASNYNIKFSQRFFNIVLLEKCRDDIRNNNKLNYHLYLALKKSLFKPAAFYKGILLPLAQSGTCTLREATIIGSVVAKVSIPSIHSAAALLKLTELPYTGSTSVFIKILLMKKYALPLRVIEALLDHFYSMLDETRVIPVIWHQALLVFVQRYKLEFSETQIDQVLQLVKKQNHPEIAQEIRREIVVAKQQRGLK